MELARAISYLRNNPHISVMDIAPEALDLVLAAAEAVEPLAMLEEMAEAALVVSLVKSVREPWIVQRLTSHSDGDVRAEGDTPAAAIRAAHAAWKSEREGQEMRGEDDGA